MTQYRKRRQGYGKFEYSEWHRTLDATLYMMDFDSVEFRAIDKKGICPVAIIETTSFPNDNCSPAPAYLYQILEKYDRPKSFQGTALRHVAKKLRVDAYIVLHTLNMKRFWVCNYSGNKKWFMMNEQLYKRFLELLPASIMALG